MTLLCVRADERSDALLTPQTRISRVFPARVPIQQKRRTGAECLRVRRTRDRRTYRLWSDPLNVGQIVHQYFFCIVQNHITKLHFWRK